MLPARNDSLICWCSRITQVGLIPSVLAIAAVGIACGAAPTTSHAPATAIATTSAAPGGLPATNGPLSPDLTAPDAPIAPPPPAAPIDISNVKAHLTMVSDDDGNIYAYTLDPDHEAVAFYGDGKTMYAQYVYDMKAHLDGDGYRVDIATPYGQRSTFAEATVFADEHKQLTLICKGNEAGLQLHPVPAAEKKRILDTAQFLPRKWNRHLALLARDDTGIYFLADRAWGHDHTDYHVYLGKRGAMRQVALSNVVDDDAGMIFSTARGELRLVQGTDHVVYWVNKGIKTPLIFLDLAQMKNQQMVFHDLGVYGFVGAPCEGVQ